MSEMSYNNLDKILILLTFIIFALICFYINSIFKKFLYRKEKELKNKFRLIEVVFENKKTFKIEKINDGIWIEFADLGKISEIGAKKEFLKLTKDYVTPIINVVE